MLYDTRDSMPAADRERALFTTLRETMAHAVTRLPGWANRLRGIDPNSILSRDDLSALPITRK